MANSKNTKIEALKTKLSSAGRAIKSGAKTVATGAKVGVSKARVALSNAGQKISSFSNKVTETIFRTSEDVENLRNELNKQSFWFANETSGKHMMDRWPFGHGKYVENLNEVIDDKFYGQDFDSAKRVYNFDGVFGKNSNFTDYIDTILSDEDCLTSASLLANGFNTKNMLGKMRDMELNKSATQKRLNTISGRKNYAPSTDEWARLALNEDNMSVYDFECLMAIELCAKNPVLLESKWLDQEAPEDYAPAMLGKKQLKDFPHMAVIENFDDVMDSIARHTNIDIVVSDSVNAGQVELYKNKLFSSLRGIKNYIKKAGNARASGVRGHYTMTVSNQNTQGEQIYMALKALSEVSVKHFIGLTEQSISEGAENLPSAEQFNQDKDTIARISACLIASDMCYMFNLEKNDADVLSNAFMVEALLNFDKLKVSEENIHYMPLIADYYAESINSFAQDFQVDLTAFARNKGIDADTSNIGNILYAKVVPTATNVLGEPTMQRTENNNSNFLYEQIAEQQKAQNKQNNIEEEMPFTAQNIDGQQAQDEVSKLFEKERNRRLTLQARQQIQEKAKKQEARERKNERTQYYATKEEQKRKLREDLALERQEKEDKKQANLNSQQIAKQNRDERDENKRLRKEILDRYAKEGDYRATKTDDTINKMQQAQAEATALKNVIDAKEMNDKIIQEAKKDIQSKKDRESSESIFGNKNVDVVELAKKCNEILEKERLERERIEREKLEAEELKRQKNIILTSVGLPNEYDGFQKGDKSKCPTSVLNKCQEYVANAVEKNWTRQYLEGRQVIEDLRTAEGTEATSLVDQAKRLYIERELSANVGYILGKVSGKHTKNEHPEFDDLSKYTVEHEVVKDLQKVAESLANKVVEFRQVNADKLGEKFTTATFKQYVKAEGGMDAVINHLDKAVNIVLNNGFYGMLSSNEKQNISTLTETKSQNARIATLDEFSTR